MSLGCSVSEVLGNIKEESRKVLADGIKTSDNTFTYKFGPNNRFKTKEDLYAHIKRKGVQIEALIKRNLPSLSSNGFLNLHTDGNQVRVTIQIPGNFVQALNKAYNENYSENITEESSDTFTDKLSQAIEEELNFQNNMDTGFTDADDMYFNMADVNSLDTIFEGSFNKYYEFLQSLVYKSRVKLNEIKRAKADNKSNPDILKELYQKEAEIKNLLNGDISVEGDIGIVQQLAEMEKEPTLSKLVYYSEKNLNRLRQLVKSDDLHDLIEAQSIINFYEAIGTFDSRYQNPLFTEAVVDNEGNVTVDEGVKEVLENLKAEALAEQVKLEARKRAFLTERINDLSNIKSFFNGQELTFDEMFSKQTGLKDITEVDKFIMDVSNGIFSNNGIIPQVMLTILHNHYDTSLVKAKEIEEKTDSLVPKVEAILHKLGYGFTSVFGKGVRYEEVFRAKGEDGTYKKHYISRYSTKFKDNYEFRRREFFNKLEIANGLPKVDYKKAIKLRKDAYNDFKKWIKAHTVTIDITKIPEFADEFSELGISADESYKNELIDLLGNGDKRVGLIAYNEEIEKQREKLKEYLTQRQLALDAFLHNEGVDDIADLSAESLERFKRDDAAKNPVNFSNNINHGAEVRLKAGPSGVLNELSSEYSILIPKRSITETYDHNINTGEFKTREVESGYYDKRFEVIEQEGHEALKEFHNLLLSTTETIYNSLDPSDKENFGKDVLLHLDKTIIEILTDKDMTLFAKLLESAKLLYEKLLGAITERINTQFSKEQVDVITGLPTDRVNSEFFNSSKAKVSEQHHLLSSVVQKMFGTKDRKLNTTIKKDKLNSDYVSIIDGLVGQEIRQKMFAKYGEFVPVYKVLQDAIEHKIVSSQSFDLPKIMKFFSFSAMEYQARVEALPILNMIRQYYKEIEKPVTTAQGKGIINKGRGKADDTFRKEGVRTRANAQMDSWFNRAVLGNYNSKNEFGDTSGLFERVVGDSKADKYTNKVLSIANGRRFYTRKEKELLEQYDTVIAQKQDEYDEASASKDREKADKLLAELSMLNTKREALGKQFTMTSFIDGLFNFIRLKGLGWNLSSQTTNFLEGQIANTISAASGKYFSPENIYRANNIMGGSTLRNISFGRISTKEAKKARVLMDRFRVLQDTSNELQKASAKSSATKIAQAVSPYEIMKRVEYLNQTPLMIASLLDIKVTDNKGENEINLWDALDENGQFIEGYDTEQNLENWVNVKGEQFLNFSQKLGKTIVDVHGDYHQLRGNMASEYISGKAILMFKRWFARQAYNRFGVEQVDIELGQVVKGRYKSLTIPTGATIGALVGFSGLALIGAGPLGLILGGALGTFHSAFTGRSSGIGLIEESTFVLKEAFLNLIRVPINSISGKQVISETDYSKFSKMQEIDLKNFKANITEISLMLALNAFALLIKGLLWDDDDDEDSAKRKAHNLLINKLMGLSGQASQYLNPYELVMMFADMSFLKFLEDVRLTAVAAGKALQGEDTLMSGPDAGGSKFMKQASKTFVPGMFKDGLGFGTQMQRQFEPNIYDSWFHNAEKKSQSEIKRIKASIKKKYDYSELTEEQQKEIDRALRGIFTKSKGETYSDRLEKVEELLESNSEELEEKIVKAINK